MSEKSPVNEAYREMLDHQLERIRTREEATEDDFAGLTILVGIVEVEREISSIKVTMRGCRSDPQMAILCNRLSAARKKLRAITLQTSPEDLED